MPSTLLPPTLLLIWMPRFLLIGTSHTGLPFCFPVQLQQQVSALGEGRNALLEQLMEAYQQAMTARGCLENAANMLLVSGPEEAAQDLAGLIDQVGARRDAVHGCACALRQWPLLLKMS
jgi:hypothetical protein